MRQGGRKFSDGWKVKSSEMHKMTLKTTEIVYAWELGSCQVALLPDKANKISYEYTQ